MNTVINIQVIVKEEKEFDVSGEKLGKLTYEKFLSEGDPQFAWQVPTDEWQAICLNYTSGTTGNPKGGGISPSRRSNQCYLEYFGLGY